MLQKLKKSGLVRDEERTEETFEANTERKLPVLKEVKSKGIKTDPDKPNHILIEEDNSTLFQCSVSSREIGLQVGKQVRPPLVFLPVLA